MKCLYCGNQYDDKFDVCPMCGTLKGTSVPYQQMQVSGSNENNNINNNNAPSGNFNVNGQANTSENKQKKKNNFIPVIILVAAVLFLGLISSVVIILNKKTGDNETKSTVANNGSTKSDNNDKEDEKDKEDTDSKNEKNSSNKSKIITGVSLDENYAEFKTSDDVSTDGGLFGFESGENKMKILYPDGTLSDEYYDRGMEEIGNGLYTVTEIKDDPNRVGLIDINEGVLIPCEVGLIENPTLKNNEKVGRFLKVIVATDVT